MDGSTSDKAKLAGKLVAIMRSIGRIEKDKEVTGGQRFKYLSEEAMKTIIQPLFIEHGVMPVPINMELLDKRLSPTEKQVIDTVRLTYEFIDTETGVSVVAMAIGTGADMTDKSSGKAITNALKYVLHSMFVIPTGADPEKGTIGGAEGNTSAPQSASRGRKSPDDRISEPQKKRIFALMNKAGKTVEQVKAIVGAAGYEHTADIQVKAYEAICREIES